MVLPRIRRWTSARVTRFSSKCRERIFEVSVFEVCVFETPIEETSQLIVRGECQIVSASLKAFLSPKRGYV